MAKKGKPDIRPIITDKAVSVSPYLVGEFSFHGALVIQRIHFWCEFNMHEGRKTHYFEGRWWMHRTYLDWLPDLPGMTTWLSVQRLIKRLASLGVILTRKCEGNKGLWYALDYEILRGMIPAELQPDWMAGGEERYINLISDDISNRYDHYIKMIYPLYQIDIEVISFRDIPSIYIDSHLLTQDITSDPPAAESSINIFELYEQNIGALSPLLVEELKAAEQEYTTEWIEEAIREAVLNNVRHWKYVRAILGRMGRGEQHEYMYDPAALEAAGWDPRLIGYQVDSEEVTGG